MVFVGGGGNTYESEDYDQDTLDFLKEIEGENEAEDL